MSIQPTELERINLLENNFNEIINSNDYKAVAAVIQLKTNDSHKAIIASCESAGVKSPIIIDNGVTKLPLHLFDLQTWLSTNGLSNPEVLKGQGAGKSFKAVYDLREEGDSNEADEKEFVVITSHCALNIVDCDLTTLVMQDNLITFQKQAMNNYVAAMFQTATPIVPAQSVPIKEKADDSTEIKTN